MTAKTVRLGDVCQIVSGSTPSTREPGFWNGTLNWITPAEIPEDAHEILETQRRITQLAVDRTGLHLMPAGTVLLSSRAPIGKVAIAGSPMYCNQGFKNFICGDEIHNKFLFWFLKNSTDLLNSLGRGTTFKEISKNIVSSIQITLPSIDEQVHIANVLDTTDNIIKKYRQMFIMSDLLVKSKFFEMFGNFPNNEKNFLCDTIGNIAVDIRYGTSRPSTDDGKYPYIRMNNITYDGELDITNLKYINIPDNELQNCTVKYGDVLFNRTNSRELVGKTCVYNRNETMVIAGFIIRIRVNDRILPEFLSSFLNTKTSKKMLFELCKPSIGQANINAQELKKIALYVPPMEEQEKFVNIRRHVDKWKTVVRRQLADAEALKRSLLARFFGSGA